MTEVNSRLTKPKRSKFIVAAALLVTIDTLLLGYLAFGFLTSLIFSSGFLGGFLLWYFVRSETPYKKLKYPYFACLALFLIHRVEEKYLGFFAFLADVTGVRTPEVLSWQVIALVVISVGSWLSIPFFLRAGHEFGYYFVWTFFAAMGITELAHWLVFPFVLDHPFHYVPGMISVLPLAPFAWVGMYRLIAGRTRKEAL